MKLCYQCGRTYFYHGATKTYVGGRVLCKDTRTCRQLAAQRAERMAEIRASLGQLDAAHVEFVLSRVRWADRPESL